jgi:SOS-response transcriptional repressor LexA
MGKHAIGDKDFLQRNVQRGGRMLSYIKDYTDIFGYCPSFREIGASAGVQSTSIIAYYVTNLTKAGYLSNTRGVTRSTHVTEKGMSFLNEWKGALG